jgi:hypothetical protein
MAFLPASRPAFACASMTFITTHQCDYEDDQVEVMWTKLVNKEKKTKKKNPRKQQQIGRSNILWVSWFQNI